MKGMRPWKNVWSHLRNSEVVPCYVAAKIFTNQLFAFFGYSYSAVNAGDVEFMPLLLRLVFLLCGAAIFLDNVDLWAIV